ncbi:MAG TPA: hypothetical protein P5157_02365 [Paludibacteraceae bacterium]|nr:hypothetical protein [Paludibacteraceae bacterium]HON02284.1 hypothetical protein [Paludibacteraceae bacterium]HRS23728.1 hypothetical protein [Paludibacteraceae bacterium]
MNIKQLKRELKKQLKKEKYPKTFIYYKWDLLKFKHAKYFELLLPTESYCLEEKNNKWEVYYIERGTKLYIKEFSSENEACEYFYNWIMQRNSR